MYFSRAGIQIFELKDDEFDSLIGDMVLCFPSTSPIPIIVFNPYILGKHYTYYLPLHCKDNCIFKIKK